MRIKSSQIWFPNSYTPCFLPFPAATGHISQPHQQQLLLPRQRSYRLGCVWCQNKPVRSCHFQTGLLRREREQQDFDSSFWSETSGFIRTSRSQIGAWCCKGYREHQWKWLQPGNSENYPTSKFR